MKFKHSIQWACTLLILFSMVGCQDLEEDPKSELTPGTYLNNEVEMEGAVASMYTALVVAQDGGYGTTFRMTTYFGSDDLTTLPGSNKGPFRDFDRFMGTSDNGFANRQWTAPWNTLTQANFVLDNIDGVDASQAYVDGAAGQAHFLRGLAYYYLVRTFGKVPLVTTTNFDVNVLLDRSPVADVYALIVSDLMAAESLLPQSWDAEPAKATRFSASALLADVYLTMAGYPLNDTSKYSLAAASAKKVIDEGGFTLVPSYAEVFQTNGNSEMIFGMWYNNEGGLRNRGFGATATPGDEIAANGGGGWHDFYVEIAFFENAPVCTRTDETFHTELKIRQSDGTTNFVNWDDPSTSQRHPYYEKFRSGLVTGGVGDGVVESATEIFEINPSTDKSTDIIRYPHVLLNYAEAVARQGAPTSEAYAAINEVRSRAGLLDLAGLSQSDFIDAVVYERAYEFAGEFGVRWFDIVRLQLLPEVIAARNTDEINGIPRENALSIQALTDPSNFYIAPIPNHEMAKNPHWTQNPGYGE